MRSNYFYSFLLVIGTFFSNSVSAQFYNGSYQEFGQNRIQFNQIKWQSHDYERFKVETAQAVSQQAQALASNLKEHPRTLVGPQPAQAAAPKHGALVALGRQPARAAPRTQRTVGR